MAASKRPAKKKVPAAEVKRRAMAKKKHKPAKAKAKKISNKKAIQLMKDDTKHNKNKRQLKRSPQIKWRGKAKNYA